MPAEVAELSRRRRRGLHTSLVVASPLALLLLSLAVGSALAHHQGHLSDPSMSPRQIAVGGTVAVGVTYTDDAGAAPITLVATVDRATAPLTAGSDAFKKGVRYQASVSPTAGWHAVSFTATDATGEKETVWAGNIQVKSGDTPKSSADPTPTGKASPSPKSTGTSTPAPTPVAGHGGEGDGKSGTGGGEGSPRATPGNGSSATSAPGKSSTPEGPRGSPSPGATPARGGAASPNPGGAGQTGKRPGAVTTTGPGAGGQGGTAEPSGSADLALGGGRPTDASAGTGAKGNVVGRAIEETRGALAIRIDPARLQPLAQDRHPSLPTLLRELTPTIVTATTGGAAWAAFVIFGKRRRDGDESEPDSLLATSAATAMDTVAAPCLRVVDESLLPRWRRPSLQQVRKTDPLRAVAEAPSLSFAKEGVRPLERYERRQIRYRLVRLLDCPDEVRASEIGILDRGDEVQLLERYRVYWRVLSPDGRTGWVHRMTLSEAASESALDAPGAVEPASDPAFGMTEGPAEAVAAARQENADGLLEAYMRARSDVPRPVEFEAVPVGDASVETIEVEPASAIEPAPTAEPSVALARDHLERAGFAVQSPEPAARPAVKTRPATAPIDEPSGAAAPAAEPERADGRYSGRKSGGSRKAATASRPGTKSRRPSR